jgi:hypothetical protein
MAQAYAATQPSAALSRKYLAEMRKQRARGSISADDFVLLRCSLEAKQALMDATSGGNADAFQEGTVLEVLEKARENVASEVRTQFDAVIDAKKSENEELVSAKKDVESQLSRLQAKEESRASIVEQFVATIITTLVWGLGALIAGGLLLGMATSVWGFPSFTQAWIRYLFAFLQLCALIAGLINVIFGNALLGCIQSIAKNLTGLITAKLKMQLKL